MIFLRYASSQLRRVSSAHTSALPGRDFAVPCLAQKSLRFAKLDLFALCCVMASPCVLDVHEYVCGTRLRHSLPSTKISAFFSPLRTAGQSRQRKSLCSLQRAVDWLFLSLDTILSNRIKKLSIAFVVHNRCFIKISLDGHLA